MKRKLILAPGNLLILLNMNINLITNYLVILGLIAKIYPYCKAFWQYEYRSYLITIEFNY